MVIGVPRRKGCQTPRLHVGVPTADIAYDSVDDIEMLAETVGISLYPWQKLVLRDWSARDVHDELVYGTDGLSVPRQNGKNVIIEIYELYGVAVCGWHILHTAHRVNTSKEAFNRLCDHFREDVSPDLYAMVDHIRRTNGEEAIYLKNGGCIQFSSRSTSGRRGFSDIQLVVFDEAQELTSGQLEALMYTLAASSTGERQMIYTGTPPSFDSAGEVFPRMRAAALDNPVPGTSWIEWSIERCYGRDASWLDVIDDVYQTNPSLGWSTLSEDGSASEFAVDDIVGFCIERLGWWRSMTRALDKPISEDAWHDAEVQHIDWARYNVRTCIGIKFSPDGSTFAVAGARISQSGDVAVELIMTGGTSDGMTQLASWLAARTKRVACVVVDGQGAAYALYDRLRDAGVTDRFVIRSSTQVVVQAAALVIDMLAEGQLVHGTQDMLAQAATGSVRRWVGRAGGWSFGSTDKVDSTPIEAVALAVYGTRNSRRVPGRKQQVI